MEIFTTKVRTNLDGVLQTTQMINGIMMTGDNAANQILVELYRGIDRIDIDPNTKIVGYFIRSDGMTMEEDGTIEDNMIKVVIPEVAYQVSGSLSIAIRMFDDPTEKTVTTRQYAVVTTRRKYRTTQVTRQYLNVTSHRRYYDEDLDLWVDLADGEEAPDGAQVEEYQVGEWVDLADGETAPDGAEVKATVNYVTVILEDDVTPPAGVDVETETIKTWITLGEGEEAPAGAEVVSNTENIVTWGTKIVVAAMNVYVQITETDSIIDVYHHIPDVQELLAYIESVDVLRTSLSDAESVRVAAESNRQANETTRQRNETTRQANENTRKYNETARGNAQAARNAMIDNMTVAATGLAPTGDPTATISDVNGHKHIQFGLVPGVGVEDAYLTNEQKLKMKFTDGTHYLSSTSLRGPKGEDGTGMTFMSYDSGTKRLELSTDPEAEYGAISSEEINSIFAGV